MFGLWNDIDCCILCISRNRMQGSAVGDARRSRGTSCDTRSATDQSSTMTSSKKRKGHREIPRNLQGGQCVDNSKGEVLDPAQERNDLILHLWDTKDSPNLWLTPTSQKSASYVELRPICHEAVARDHVLMWGPIRLNEGSVRGRSDKRVQKDFPKQQNGIWLNGVFVQSGAFVVHPGNFSSLQRCDFLYKGK